MRQISIEERLARDVQLNAATGCIEWTGRVTVYGYGQIAMVVSGRARAFIAHREAWRVSRGPIPAGMHVLHKCDNRRCVNVDHLFLGTWSDNSRDMVQKNRQARGERIGVSKLTAEKVAEILSSPNDRLATLAQRMGVSPSTVGRVRKRLIWRHVENS